MLGSVEPERPSSTGDITPRSLGAVALVSGLMVLAIGAGLLLTTASDKSETPGSPGDSESIGDQRRPDARVPAGVANPAGVPSPGTAGQPSNGTAGVPSNGTAGGAAGAVIPGVPAVPSGVAPLPSVNPPGPAAPHPVEIPVVIPAEAALPPSLPPAVIGALAPDAQRPTVPLPVIAPVDAAAPIGGPGCSRAALLLPLTLPNGGWVCTDPVPAAEQPRLGAPCATNGIASQWDLLPIARWVCVPQQPAPPAPPAPAEVAAPEPEIPAEP